MLMLPRRLWRRIKAPTWLVATSCSTLPPPVLLGRMVDVVADVVVAAVDVVVDVVVASEDVVVVAEVASEAVVSRCQDLAGRLETHAMLAGRGGSDGAQAARRGSVQEFKGSKMTFDD